MASYALHSTRVACQTVYSALMISASFSAAARTGAAYRKPCQRHTHSEGYTDRMTRDQLGVHGRITHPQTESPPDFELRVQDSKRIVRLAHAAGSNRMTGRRYLVPNEFAELLVA